jgi:hypothetical protein
MGNGFVETDPGYPRPLIDVCRHAGKPLFARSVKGREKPNCEGEQHESPQSPDRSVHGADHRALFLRDFGRDLRADDCAFLTWSRNRSSSRIRILRLVIVSLTTERRF